MHAGKRVFAQLVGHLLRIKLPDAEHNKDPIFLFNNFDLPALTIVQLYRCRWQVEQFFKWIKQHLRIKAFYGHRERREDANRDYDYHLRLARHRKETSQDRSIALHNSTNSEPDTL